MAWYVLVASPELTMPPMDAGMEVLKVYGGVVNVGVGTRKLGRVVSIVVCGVNEDKLTEDVDVWEGVGVVTVLLEFPTMLVVRGYRPIFGGSFVSIP